MLKVDSIDTYYGHVQALRGLSLEVQQGELVTLVGANGAGKTTTLKTISGLITPATGNIEFLRKRIDGLSPNAILRLGIAHCPEGRRVFPDMTVLENLEMGAYVRHDRQEIRQDLERVFTLFPRLAERRSQLAGTLSGGEQQMLAIGRALMSRPKLMMFDEPSLGLAPFLVETVAKIILDIHRQGTTVLLVEQNARLALSMADRGYVLETGTVALHGQAKDLLENEHVKKAYLGG
ncbi:MAG: ABC transporter ATP-binding protein [Chloroflexi bacterium]|nr:ABC transporter ATP-binding protein [Chloroflexota bacterium]